MTDRSIHGYLVLPDDAQPAGTGRACIELRDVSQMDRPSSVLAVEYVDGIVVRPGATIAFTLHGPEADPARSLALRVQVDVIAIGGEAVVYLTTMAYPVPPAGDADVGAVRLVRP